MTDAGSLPRCIPTEAYVARFGHPRDGLISSLSRPVVVQQIPLVLLPLAHASEGDSVAVHLALNLARLVVVDPGHGARHRVVFLLDLQGELPAVRVHHPRPTEVIGPN